MKAPPRRTSCRRRGFALVVTMAALILMSVLLLAFFSSALLNRQVSFSSTNLARTGYLARTSLDFITGEILQEIFNGSTNSIGTNGWVFHIPLTNLYAAPIKSGVSGTNATDNGRFTIAKVSAAGTALRTGGIAASSNLITGKSQDGRWISTNRWFGSGGPGLGSQTGVPAWFYITRGGVTTPSVANAKNRANADFVVGRFACTVYDVGGLLNANVAGYPSVASTNARYKSSTAYADLTALDPGNVISAGVNTLVGWRNGSAAESAAAYASYLTNTAIPNSFYEVVQGQNGFIGRKDLLNAASGSLGLTTKAVSSLTHFSHAYTGPTWKPTTTSTNVDYASAAYNEAAASENRNLLSVRVNPAFTREDGIQAELGEPLIKSRFPLSRLALITPTASAATGDPIHRYFGLTRAGNSGSWTYNHGDPNSIHTLDEVRVAGREPDFFELLKAVILNGSLGRDPGPQNNPIAEVVGAQNNTLGPCGQFFGPGQSAAPSFIGYSSIPDAQILRIGACIIDQYDADSYPTSIYMNSVSNPAGFSAVLNTLFNTVHGVENLPYIYSLRTLRYRDPNVEPPNGHHYAWQQPALWNPHQQLPASYTGALPAGLRLRIYGRSQMSDWAGSGTGANTGTSERILDYDNPPSAYAGFEYINFTNGAGFYNSPVWLTTSLAGSSNAINVWKAAYGMNASTFVGFFVGHMMAAEVFEPDGITHKDWGNGLIVGSNNPTTVTIVAEFQDATGAWRPYDQLARSNAFSGHGWAPENNPLVNVLGNVDLSRADPRTDRFSFTMGWGSMAAVANNSNGLNSYWPANGTFRYGQAFVPSANRGFTYSGDRLMAATSVNLSSSLVRYTDYDGNLRTGDAFRGNDATGEGRPTYSGSPDHLRRPVILNRPFESVAELGYVFRDLPFKTLDFWSRTSADSGLLDVFSIGEEPEWVTDRINPNAAPNAVFQAIFSGAAKKETAVSTNVGAEAAGIATAVADYFLANGPIRNPAEFITATGASANLGDSLNAGFAAADRANKASAEAPIRALAPAMQTRSWNFLVDVVAQAGRVTPSASQLGDFQVEGEKRYWLHVAIDRYTGEIIDRQLEPVYE